LEKTNEFFAGTVEGEYWKGFHAGKGNAYQTVIEEINSLLYDFLHGESDETVSKRRSISSPYNSNPDAPFQTEG